MRLTFVCRLCLALTLCLSAPPAALTVSLPPAGVGAKDWSFCGEQVTIAGMVDEVELLHSLQKPKKVSDTGGAALPCARWHDVKRWQKCNRKPWTCASPSKACSNPAQHHAFCPQIKLIGSDGRTYCFLAKPKDDLRKVGGLVGIW